MTSLVSNNAAGSNYGTCSSDLVYTLATDGLPFSGSEFAQWS